jgi:hypothetical protein
MGLDVAIPPSVLENGDVGLIDFGLVKQISGRNQKTLRCKWEIPYFCFFFVCMCLLVNALAHI